jgi:hypothetical protein
MKRRGPLSSVLICLALGGVLGGCSAVLSTRPIGEQPLVLVAEEWDGTWTDSEDFLEIRVVDAEQGRLEAAWIEKDDEGFELERIEVLIRQSGETTFANAREMPDDDSDGDSDSESDSDRDGTEDQYAFFRLGREGTRRWMPSRLLSRPGRSRGR